MSDDLYLVAGLGKTGLSIARYLSRRNKPFVLFDTRNESPSISEFRREFPEVALYTQELPREIMHQITEVIASPGLSWDTPLVQNFLQRNIPLYGDIECLAREIHAPVIAITGTNGKSTVTTLVGEMAQAAGFKVAVAGNIGNPVLDLLDDAHQYDLWVLELSSFQLDLTHSLKARAATILNVSPDHLDRHHNMQAYIAAKQRIYRNAELVLYNSDDAATFPEHKDQVMISFGQAEPPAVTWGIRAQQDKISLMKGDTEILPVGEMLIQGIHNWLNALAAAALAESAGVPLEYVRHVLRTYPGLPHRCQWVRTLDTVHWINDSKGTNIGATISAINGIGGAMQGRIVLIAGGQGKGADFSEMAKPVADFVRSLVLIGEDADKMAAALNNVVPIERASSLEDAVLMARKQAKPGDVVLLSPACASQDMFKDFNHRGDVFTSIINGL